MGVWFGEPLSKGTDAANVRLAVQESIADLAIRDSDHIVLLHRAFVRNACKFRNLFRPCVIDNATGPARTLSWGKTLVGALCVTRYLKSRLGDAANVGVWLPTGLGGALANLAIAFLHRVSVNLNYTAGTAPVRSAIQQAGIRDGHHVEAVHGSRAAGIARGRRGDLSRRRARVDHEVAAHQHLPQGARVARMAHRAVARPPSPLAWTTR